MPSVTKLQKPGFIEQNIAYYNEVAGIYNSILDSDRANEIVRRKVKEKFLSLVKSGTVLDFGGGTGLDLEWLAAANYKIYFCEPSVAMRNQAIKSSSDNHHESKVEFLQESKTDFTKWSSAPPFATKVDGILCNFGVVNYIPDIRALFHSLARVTSPGGHLMCVMLELDLRKRFKWHRRNAIQSLLFGQPFKMYIPYKEHKQAVVVHTADEVKKASSRYFTFVQSESLDARDFTLIHLIRNEEPC
jgi:SAM-dependent methyltransferase